MIFINHSQAPLPDRDDLEPWSQRALQVATVMDLFRELLQMVGILGVRSIGPTLGLSCSASPAEWQGLGEPRRKGGCVYGSQREGGGMVEP